MTTVANNPFVDPVKAGSRKSRSMQPFQILSNQSKKKIVLSPTPISYFIK